jgi:cytochrome c556
MAGAALAQGAGAPATMPPGMTGAEAVKQRQHNFKQLGGAFKTLTDEMRKPEPDRAVVSAAATKMASLANEEESWFPKGSGPEAGVKTAAKPIIWSDPHGFHAAVLKLQVETNKLQRAAVAGDLAAVRVGIRDTGGACKNCHDRYRVPEKH